MVIVIDDNSGFCPGVVRAIGTAETELGREGKLYCLGDIVHNGQEVERLSLMGLKCIDQDEFFQMHGGRVLLRAHGEPPATYQVAERNGIRLIDATCKVVLQLQKKIKQAYADHPDAQIVIYGKVGHAEVIGLNGQCENKAIIVEREQDLDKIDYSREIILFSQTTMSIDTFGKIVNQIKNRIQGSTTSFTFYDTICRQVANRIPNIKDFARKYDLILFIAGKKSSNGRILFDECRQVNNNSHHITSADEMESDWFLNISSVGICGATSTPKWQMEEVARRVKDFISIF
mgnify:CR=1 FL=1